MSEVVMATVMYAVAVAAEMYVVVVAVVMSVPPSSVDMGRLVEPVVMANVAVIIHPYQSNPERKGKAVEGAMVVAKAARVAVVDAETVMSKIYACQDVSLNDENVQVNLETCEFETVEALEWSTYS
uniref:Uncharacterized protein n=1 Tax=Cannabis sativa TaxID=3483 RepID=A0A803NHX9_CANSA